MLWLSITIVKKTTKSRRVRVDWLASAVRKPMKSLSHKSFDEYYSSCQAFLHIRRFLQGSRVCREGSTEADFGISSGKVNLFQGNTNYLLERFHRLIVDFINRTSKAYHQTIITGLLVVE